MKISVPSGCFYRCCKDVRIDSNLPFLISTFFKMIMFDASGDNDVVFPEPTQSKIYHSQNGIGHHPWAGLPDKFGTVRSFNSYNRTTGCWITVFGMVKCTPDCVPSHLSFVTSFLLITIFLPGLPVRYLWRSVAIRQEEEKFPRFLGHPDKLESTFHRV